MYALLLHMHLYIEQIRKCWIGLWLGIRIRELIIFKVKMDAYIQIYIWNKKRIMTSGNMDKLLENIF